MDIAFAGGVPAAEPTTRFGWVLSHAYAGPDKTFDRDLARSPHGAVTPTKGALIPEWLLVIPRERCPAVAKLPSPQREELLKLADVSEDVVSKVAAKSAVVFEHGAGSWGSVSGCGVEQAHLHVVGLGEDFLSFVLEQSHDVEWAYVSRSAAWSLARNMFDYLLMGAGQHFWVAEAKTPISQFFRRHAAAYLKNAGEWDYKTFPQRKNGYQTARLFEHSFR